MVKALCARQSQVRFSDISVLIMYQCAPSNLFLLCYNCRYNDEIMCLAARVIRALRTRASKQSIGNINGDYDAIHIRRGDFQKQFTMTKMDASEILAGLKDTITPGKTLFIATDERDLTFFSSIKEVYDVAFLGDFGTLLNDISKCSC